MKSSKTEATEIDARHVLQTLFEFARADEHATPRGLARATGLCEQEVLSLLDQLQRLCLVDAKRCRLTMPGLVLASCSEARSAGSRIDRAA